MASIRAAHTALDLRVGYAERSVDTMSVSLEAKHAENRKSIHDLRNGQQMIMDLVHRIDLKLARATGYAVGAGAIVALFAKFIDKVWR